MTIRHLIAAASLAAASLAQASPVTAKAPVSSWPEPSTFMGISLGTALTAQPVLIACPQAPLYRGSAIMFRDLNDKRFCYEQAEGDPDYAVLWNEPDLGFGFSTELIVSRGEVHGLILRLQRLEVQALLNLLVSRFGQPTSVRVADYQNKLGATYSGKVFSWEGRTVHMELSEYGSKVNESSFVLLTGELQKRRQEEASSNTDRFKSRL